MAHLVHGGPISEALQQAREARNARIRAEVRPLAAEAAERRMKDQMWREKQKGNPKKKVKLMSAWEEGGTSRRGFGG